MTCLLVIFLVSGAFAQSDTNALLALQHASLMTVYGVPVSICSMANTDLNDGGGGSLSGAA